jgi:cyclin-dependent kinase-like
LLQLLESNPQGLPFITNKNLIYQLCKAIEWCHSREIIHRDIKPENLLISNEGKLKLCDFGFARRIAHDTHNLALTEYVATRWYRPPELLLNCSYGKPVDIWALGTIFGELTDGQPLFAGDSDIDQLYVIQQVLGHLPQYQLEALHKNMKFNSYKFPRAIDCTTLVKRYENSANEIVLDFIDSCLQLDPVKRMTISDCLTHKLFRSQNGELKSARVSQS